MIQFLLLGVSFLPMQKEAASYWTKITGKQMPRDAIVFAVDENVSRNGNDAYEIVSTDSGARVVGSNVRSVWYGLYDLLERRGGCHWFWDGDIVPRRDSIDLKGLNVREEAGFQYRAIRYFAHRGLTRFQAEHWGFDDWKQEIDWCLKRRLNVFMLRIGQDDLFQKAFPGVVPYPDPALPIKGVGEGYDNRSLFWPLEFRGSLRTSVQRYGRERGLLIPEDFGTMTHWYSRTPCEFLEKMKPDFLPQATSTYSEKSGLVWDVRENRWADAYWRLTTTAVDEYGSGKPDLLHTIGLGERRCFTNRADNLNLKIETLKTFIGKARRDYPNTPILLAGWDFYFTWYPEEVRKLIAQLDPKHTVIWDYEGDAVEDGNDYMKGVGNNFTKWGVVGKFPYTYSMFLAYESALDVRANYPIIAERFKIVKNDPMCKGFLFWPEASHTDTLALQYFTANAWSRENEEVGEVLTEFCQNRYGSQSERMHSLWLKTIPISRVAGWGGNYGRSVVFCLEDAHESEAHLMPECLTNAVSVLEGLSRVDMNDSFVVRDVIDMARTIADRVISDLARRLMRSYCRWREGRADGAQVTRLARAYAELGAATADLLELHVDYSLYESYLRLNDVEPIRNPHFDSVLFDNASCNYCHSHQYELARYWYEPVMCKTADLICDRVRSGDRSEIKPETLDAMAFRERLRGLPLQVLRPRAERSPKALRRVMGKMAEAVERSKD